MQRAIYVKIKREKKTKFVCREFFQTLGQFVSGAPNICQQSAKRIQNHTTF